MVFSSYNSSYLPLDSDQQIAFYRNENLLLPPPLLPSSVASVACRHGNGPVIMPSVVTAPNVEPPLTNPSPVVHLSSNGYYGYVPVNSIPKVMSASTIGTAATTVSGTVIGNSDGVSVQLDFTPSASPPDCDDTMMDCAEDSEMENYRQQLPLQRKRKDQAEESEITNCKRRRTWLEQQHPQHYGEVYANGSSWNQNHDSQMDSAEMQTGPVSQSTTSNGLFTNGFYHAVPSTATTTAVPTTILQQKNHIETTSVGVRWNSRRSSESRPADKHPFSENCPELQDLFISLHGSGCFHLE